MGDRTRTLSFLKRKQKSDENLLIYEDDDWKFEDEEEEQQQQGIPNVKLFFNYSLFFFFCFKLFKLCIYKRISIKTNFN